MSLTDPAPRLLPLLQQVFGHPGFRAHQQAVCEAASLGRDVLLVMPTGAGKSLCYQLPALALRAASAANPRRTGDRSPALVISPLIALMEDQAHKLSALGLRVARIHSGLPREEARAASRAYLTGELDFLFIAPERLRVPGFPEMLARRKPCLLAIDEAHCISQWGHDFRPDYRTLGQYLPSLRPTPFIALTATATPEVQRDIAVQLGLRDPAVFITGFRRDNLAIEVVERSKPERPGFITKLLQNPKARPAIVYAPSRKLAEELSGQLQAHFPTAAYHAGLDGVSRERVQRAFLTGSIEVVVATIAFGMGIDKADVRTVVHAALPGSVEAFYQEIGRAGRDGFPARTVLLHSFADRRTHEFFLERSYPPLPTLERIVKAIGTAADAGLSPEGLVNKLKLERDVVDRALEKLLGLGLVDVDHTGAARVAKVTGDSNWEARYERQITARRDQVDRMVAFAEASRCRMAALVEHFGDIEDGGKPCGRCDICAPGAGQAQTRRQPHAKERKQLVAILRALAVRSSSTGKLFTELRLPLERSAFERHLDALARAALIVLEGDTFRTEDGREIAYRKAIITAEGRTPDEATLSTVWLTDDEPTDRSRRGGRKRGRQTADADKDPAELSPAAEQLLSRLREWRSARAKALGKPAFFLFSDRVLRSIAIAAPQTPVALERVSGVGPNKAEQYGAEVLGLCSGREQDPGAKKPSTANTDNAENTPRRSAAPISGQPKRPLPAREAPLVTTSIHVKSVANGPVPLAALPEELSPEAKAREARLREWRSGQARREGLPSFFILSDSALRELAHRAPQNLEVLQGTRGFDAGKLDRYGETILELCRT